MDDPSYDQNGNVCVPTKPKESVLQILSDTLGGTQNSGELSTPVAFVPLKDSKYAAIPVSDDARSASSNNSDPNFNPGDKLCIETETSFKRKEVKKKTREKIKDCHLRTVVGSALRCLKQLSVVKQGLVSLVASDAYHSEHRRKHIHGMEKPDYQLISLLGEYTMYLSRQVFIPAHRLYTTALGLHMSEDLIRNPKDPALLSFKNGPVVRPDWNSIIHTQMKLRTCVDSATEMYHRFGREAVAAGKNKNQNEKLQHIMVTLMHAFQDLYATALGSNDIFKVLLHIEDYGEEILQEYLLSLKSNERTDLLVQVQTLRRSFDDIVIMVEQLSWTAYAVYRLALEKSLIPPSEEPSLSNIPLPPRLTENVDENGNLIEEQPSSSSSRRKSKERSRETSRNRSSSKPSEEVGSSYLEALKDPASDGSTRRRSRSQSSRRDVPSDSEEQVRDKSSEGRSSRSRKSRIPTPTSSPPTSSHRSSRTTLKGQSPTESDGYSSQLCPKSSSSKGSHRGYSTKEEPGPKSAEKSRNRSSSRGSISSKDSTSSVRSDNNKDSHHHSRSKTSKVDDDRQQNKRRDREGSSSKSSKSRQP